MMMFNCFDIDHWRKEEQNGYHSTNFSNLDNGKQIRKKASEIWTNLNKSRRFIFRKTEWLTSEETNKIFEILQTKLDEYRPAFKKIAPTKIFDEYDKIVNLHNATAFNINRVEFPFLEFSEVAEFIKKSNKGNMYKLADSIAEFATKYGLKFNNYFINYGNNFNTVGYVFNRKRGLFKKITFIQPEVQDCKKNFVNHILWQYKNLVDSGFENFKSTTIRVDIDNDRTYYVIDCEKNLAA